MANNVLLQKGVMALLELQTSLLKVHQPGQLNLPASGDEEHTELCPT